MTSSKGSLYRITGLLYGDFTGDRWIPRTKASDPELWCFFDLWLNKCLSKQSWGWRIETPPCWLWRHCNDTTLAEDSLKKRFWPLLTKGMHLVTYASHYNRTLTMCIHRSQSPWSLQVSLSNWVPTCRPYIGHTSNHIKQIAQQILGYSYTKALL